MKVEGSTTVEDFREGQWWVVELDSMAANGTAEQKRAMAVVHHMLRAARANEQVVAEHEEALRQGEDGAARLIWQSIQKGPGARPDWTLKEFNRPGGFYWNDGVSSVHVSLAELHAEEQPE